MKDSGQTVSQCKKKIKTEHSSERMNESLRMNEEILIIKPNNSKF